MIRGPGGMKSDDMHSLVLPVFMADQVAKKDFAQQADVDGVASRVVCFHIYNSSSHSGFFILLRARRHFMVVEDVLKDAEEMVVIPVRVEAKLLFISQVGSHENNFGRPRPEMKANTR